VVDGGSGGCGGGGASVGFGEDQELYKRRLMGFCDGVDCDVY